ncbi:hypothetical protein GGC64_001689 [Mycobacterium sp. OAS707]|uniref:Imm50 family immunity protein n=1 Tax=Mycobacterium sp. OAS707 TaxID=2663822 RepID=UPI00178A3163|nr:hypothetical protein [Mycobacterium sp. OAS707]
MSAPDFIQAADILVKAMGYWPSFHDADVRQATRDSDSCTVIIHVYEMTDQVDSAGFFVLRKHHLVELLMLGVQSDSLPSPYEGDVLSSLSFQRAGSGIRVTFDSHMDLGGEVVCEEVLVKSVVPYVEPGRSS